MTKSATLADVLVALERQYPTYETDLSIRTEIQNLAVLPNNPKPGRVSELLADVDHWAGRLTPGFYGRDDLLFWLMVKLPRELWGECRSTAERRAKALHYEDLCVLLLELALEKESDQHMNAYRPEGGGSGSHGKGYQGPRPGRGTTPKHARIMENVKELFSCDARDEQGHLQPAPHCEQRDCFVVQGKKQETNTGAKAKMRDHYRCTITCAFCGKRKHYEDECYHKQRLSAKLKGEDPGKGPGKGGGKGNGNDSGKGKYGKDVEKDKTRTKADQKEVLTASQTRTTRTRTRTEATPTLIQGGTPSPLEGSLVPPHARKLRPSEKKGPGVSMKVVMTATLRREPVS